MSDVSGSSVVGMLVDVRPPITKLQSASSTSAKLASLIMHASAITVTPAIPCAATNRCTSGIIVLVSARLPSNPSIINGIPVASVKPDGDLRVQAAFLGEPGLPEPVAGVGVEPQRRHVVQHQRRRADLGGGRARPGQPVPPLRLRITGQAPFQLHKLTERTPGNLAITGHPRSLLHDPLISKRLLLQHLQRLRFGPPNLLKPGTVFIRQVIDPLHSDAVLLSQLSSRTHRS